MLTDDSWLHIVAIFAIQLREAQPFAITPGGAAAGGQQSAEAASGRPQAGDLAATREPRGLDHHD